MSLRIGDLLIPNVRILQSTGTGTGNYQSKTVTPTSSQQIITAASGYDALSSVTVNAVPAETGSFTNNGTYTPTSGHWFSSITINVPTGSTISNQNKTVTPTELTQLITADAGYTGLGTVTVNGISSNYIGSAVPRKSNFDLSLSGEDILVPAGYYANDSIFTIPTETETITTNGTYTPTAGSFYSSVTVAIPSINNQNKTVNPSESSQSITADSGYTGLGTVTVNPISSNYVGSAISTRSAADVSVSGPNVTVPAGYYAAQIIKSVTTVQHPDPVISFNSNTGLITVSHSQTDGYVYADTATATYQLTAQDATTITPASTSQTAVAAGKFTTGAITVAAVPTETKSITENGTYTPTSGKWFSSVTVNIPIGSTINNQNKSVTPTESQQTISADSGYTGLGTVTVDAISNLYIGSGVIQRDSTDLTVSGATITAPAGYYASDADKSIATMTLPTAATSSATSGYTSKATISRSTSDQYINIPTGYNATGSYYKISAVENGSVSNPTIIQGTVTNHSITLTPKVVSSAGYINGNDNQRGTAITITASQLVSGSQTVTTNDTYDVTNLATLIVNVPIGSTINNQDKTVTPTTSQQIISADSGYTGLSTVTINAIPMADLVLNQMTNNSPGIGSTSGKLTFYWNNASITTTSASTSGYVDKDSPLGTTNIFLYSDILWRSATDVTSSNNIVTIPAGYYSNAVTKTIAASSLTNSVINGSATLEDTNDYAFDVTVTIPAGYYAATTLTKSFSSILPASETEGTASQVLVGYDLYNHDGQLITGSMTNNGSWNRTLDDTTTSVTIPVGYHNGSGTVSHTTVNIPDPTITIDSSTGVITASGNWTKGFTTDNSYSNTYNLTTQTATTATPTESEQTIVTAGKYTLGAIKVAAISSTYIGSEITQRSSTDLTVSGATVTAPAGYYATAASKSVASGSATGPTSLSGTGASITTGTNTITFTKTGITTTPTVVAGYVASATASTATVSLTANITPRTSSSVTASGATVTILAGYYASEVTKTISSGTATNSGSASGTSATLSTGTNTLTLTKSVSITPTVTAGYISTGTAGNVSISLTASVTTKAAATITPGTSNQTIASGTYLTGTQTISGDADLIAGNIKSGVNIFGVTGTYSGLDTSDATATAADIVDGETAYVDGRMITGNLVIQTYYTGTTAPASSLGKDGDIYLRS